MDDESPWSDYVLTQQTPLENPPLSLSIEYRSDLEKLLKSNQHELVKTVVRSHHWPINHPLRKHLWGCLAKYQSSEKHIEGFYQQMITESLGKAEPESLPSFVDPAYCLNYNINPIGKKALFRILHIISQVQPAITYSPLIYPITSLFLHYMKEDDAYYAMQDLLSKSDFIPQTKKSHEVKAYVMLKLAKKFARPLYSKLQGEIKEMETPHKIFIRWQWWLFKGFSLEYIVRILDCFLLDGIKALYRFALMSFLLFSKSSTDKEPLTGLEITEQIVYFCQAQQGNLEKFIKDSYSIRGLSRAYINQKAVKASAVLRGDIDLQTYLDASDSPFKIGGSRDTAPIGQLETDIIGSAEIIHLWSWIPNRYTTKTLQLIYSTNDDGSSLTTFYRKTDPFDATIILIKTTENDVFGAFCSESWRKRISDSSSKRLYFGTGESFLFTLKPNVQCFTWAGNQHNEESPGSSHDSMLIMSAQNDFICIGGGKDGAGLQLDSDLIKGQTHSCGTFNNEPLCKDIYFTCKVIEVLAFKERE